MKLKQLAKMMALLLKVLLCISFEPFFCILIYIYIYILGTIGSKISLITNFFEMKQSEDYCLYQYHVDFQPMIDSIKLRKFLLKRCVDLIGPVKAFDGMVLFCNRKFNKEVM